jgi:hypothetical protein
MASPPDVFLGLGSTEWTGLSAIAGGVYDVLTAALILFAGLQIYYHRREAQITRTLAACEKYDLDPVLDAICRRLAAARDSGDLQINPRSYRVDIYSVLNYLESLEIGVERGLYCGEVVRDHMDTIFVGYVEEYIKSGLVARATTVVGDLSEYDKTIALVAKWKRIPWYRRVLMSAKPKI